MSYKINYTPLEASGYKAFTPHNNAEVVYQKAIKSVDARANLYFLNVFIWNFTHFSPTAEKCPSVEAQFYREDGNTFDLNMYLDKETTVEEMESFYSDTYDALGCCSR